MYCFAMHTLTMNIVNTQPNRRWEKNLRSKSLSLIKLAIIEINLETCEFNNKPYVGRLGSTLV